MILRRLPSLPSWPTAFGELDDVRRGMERLFDSLASTAGQPTAGVYPALNVSEDSESIFVRAELPGIKSDDLEITMENDTLTIAGQRTLAAEDEQVSYHRREREWGAFRRSLSVPVPVDSDRVKANYSDGMLTVTLAKAPEARPRRIDVQAEA